jgi:hypothetical protein
MAAVWHVYADKQNTYNDESLVSLSRDCGIDPLNVLLDKSL